MAASYSIIILSCDNDLHLAKHIDQSFDVLMTTDEALCMQALWRNKTQP